MVADGGILKVLCGNRIVLDRKKERRGHYYLIESPVGGRASGARKSSK